MSDPAKIRERIAKTQAELARTEGEQSQIQEQIEQNLARVRELLGCKKGEEREALKALRDQVATDTATVEKLLDRAERARTKGQEQED